MSGLDERRARMRLASLGLPSDQDIGEGLRTVGAVETWRQLLEGDAAQSLAARRAQVIDLDEVVAETDYVEARFVIPGDAEWPSALDDLDGRDVEGTRNVPYGLWVLGLGLCPRDPVAITGARAATEYGVNVAEQMAAQLAILGHTPVTSLSFGIDMAAISGAVAVEGMAPIVVLAGGLIGMRLSGHERLVAELPERATIITEHAPAVTPSRSNLLARTRLLAALSHGTVVVEAAQRSTARTTAVWARELDRLVMAVPGPVTSCQSRMPHSLIREGALLVESADDVADELRAATITDDQFASLAAASDRSA